MRATLLIAAATVAAGALLAGCSSSSGNQNSGGPGGTASRSAGASGAKASCDLAPASLVNSVLGTQVGDPEAQNLTTVTVCRYTSTDGTGSVVLRMQTDMSSTLFTQSRTVSDQNGLKTTDFPGFADQAFTSVLSVGTHTTNTLVALKGTISILVSSPATFDAERSLEDQLFGKLS